METTTKKITFKFATAPVALFSITNSNEFKLITYLINLSNLTNNSTVSVSYSYLMQACNITCNKVIKRAIDSLITLGLINRVSGNVSTNNSYTINFNKILEIENTNKVIVPQQEQSQPTQEEAPVQEEQPQPVQEEKQPIEEEEEISNLNNKNDMEEKEIINEELFDKVEKFVLTKNDGEFAGYFEAIDYLGVYYSNEERDYIYKNFNAFKKSQKLNTLYDRVKMELIVPTYRTKKNVKEEEEYLPF